MEVLEVATAPRDSRQEKPQQICLGYGLRLREPNHPSRWDANSSRNSVKKSSVPKKIPQPKKYPDLKRIQKISCSQKNPPHPKKSPPQEIIFVTGMQSACAMGK